MFVKKGHSVGLLFSALALLFGLSGASAGQSLNEAVVIALDQYPAILAAQARAQAADSDIQRAQGAHYPQVSWQGTQSNYNTTGISNAWVQSPVVNFNIWAGGKIEADVDRSRALADVSVQQQRITRDEVALLLIEGYLNWARGLELVKLATQNVEAHDKILKNIVQIVQVDQGRRIDQDQAKVRFDNAMLSLQQREAELAVAKQRLHRMLQGKLPNSPTGLDGLPAGMPVSPEQALLDINEMHPAIAQQQAQVAAAKAGMSAARAQHMPTVNLSYGKQVNQGTAQNDYVTQLSVSIPIFSGGSASAAVQQASYQLQAAEFSLTELRLTLRERLLASWSDWISAKQRSQLGRQQVKTGEALVDGYFKQFQVGRRSLLDLLNIQADSYSYQSNAIIATFDERVSRARVQAAQGKLAASYVGKNKNNASGGRNGDLPISNGAGMRNGDLLTRPVDSLTSAATQATRSTQPSQTTRREAEVIGLETPPVILRDAVGRSSVPPQTVTREATAPVATQNRTPTGAGTVSTLQIPPPASAVASGSARGEGANENSQVNARLSKNYFSSQSNSVVTGIGSVR
ncbi:TolC Outer membrane protein [Burkholderiaceae bacterium]